MNELMREERDILEAFEAGKLNSSPNAGERLTRHQEYARAALKKYATSAAASKTRRTRPR